MTGTNARAVLRIESLLVAAHSSLALLQQRRAALANSGIGSDHLVSRTAMMAFALLGDHARQNLLQELRPHWSTLQGKGLAHGSIDVTATPVLRLLAHALPHTQAIGSVWDQLVAVDSPPAPPRGVWKSAATVRGLWGQPARLHFRVTDADYLLIEPDPVFGVQSALLALQADTIHTGSIGIPVDNGDLRMRLRHRDGHVYCQVVNVRVEEGG